MTHNKYFKNIIDFAEKNSGILVYVLDTYGVYYGAGDFYPQAIDSFRNLKRMGKTVCILSNTTESSQIVDDKYFKKGLIKGQDYDFNLTSGEYCKVVVGERLFDFPIKNETYADIGTGRPAIFEGSGLTKVEDFVDADFVYIGTPQILDENGKLNNLLQIDSFAEQIKQVKKSDLPMLCANPDYRAHEKEGYVIRPGSIAKYYEELGGKVQYVGKPYQGIYNYLKEILKKQYDINDWQRCIMVGDTIRTDIKGGQLAGMKTALIIKTGVTAQEVYNGSQINWNKIETMTKEEGIELAEFYLDQF